jgi:Uma2 family endonuclease
MTPTKEPPSVFPQFAGTRRFTPAEYRWLAEADILGPYDRVELLDGYIIYKADFVDLPTDGMFPEWRLLRRWTPDEYRRMIDLGIIKSDERLELLDGYLALQMSQNTPHRSAFARFTALLPSRLPAGWFVMPHCPVALGLARPEPDGVVVRGTLPDYDKRDPLASDLGILIEVSDSTLDLDRTAKGRLYAHNSIPVYWIINVADRQIEVYTNPEPTADPPAYTTRADYKPGDAVPIVLDGQQVATVPVSELIA